jgi:prepilin-type N-terminal cleavage/methylation domain-containing protein
MQKSAFRRACHRLASFTLIELLTVIAIIGILAALTLMAGEAVMNHAARSRASSEIQAMSTAIESYKADNGTYPSADTFASTNQYSAVDPSTAMGNNYQTSSQILYQALAGKTNFLDTPVAGGPKSYMTFRRNQVGNSSTAAGTGAGATTSTYVQDPFGNSYGYYTGDVPVPPATTQQNPPYKGTGFFDLWSTGGLIGGAQANTAAWLANWTQ